MPGGRVEKPSARELAFSLPNWHLSHQEMRPAMMEGKRGDRSETMLQGDTPCDALNRACTERG